MCEPRQATCVSLYTIFLCPSTALSRRWKAHAEQFPSSEAAHWLLVVGVLCLMQTNAFVGNYELHKQTTGGNSVWRRTDKSSFPTSSLAWAPCSRQHWLLRIQPAKGALFSTPYMRTHTHQTALCELHSFSVSSPIAVICCNNMHYISHYKIPFVTTHNPPTFPPPPVSAKRNMNSREVPPRERRSLVPVG